MVKTTHYDGGRDPIVFPIEPNLPSATPRIEEDENHLTFTSGSLSVRVQKVP